MMNFPTVTGALEGWFNRKLNKLPLDRRLLVEKHIPKWPTMSEEQRRERAREIDRQADLKLKIKHDRISRIPPPPLGSAEDEDHARAFSLSIQLLDARDQLTAFEAFKDGGNPILLEQKRSSIKECEERIEALSRQITPHGKTSSAASDPLDIQQADGGETATLASRSNTTKPSRSDAIGAVIEEAQKKCRDPNDTSQVWAQMVVLAQDEHPPFLASTAEGLKYHKNGLDAYFTRDALNKRLHPERRGKPGKRR